MKIDLTSLHKLCIQARITYQKNKKTRPHDWSTWSTGKDIDTAEQFLNANKVNAAKLLAATNLVNHCPNRDYYYVRLA